MGASCLRFVGGDATALGALFRRDVEWPTLGGGGATRWNLARTHRLVSDLTFVSDHAARFIVDISLVSVCGGISLTAAVLLWHTTMILGIFPLTAYNEQLGY